MARRSRREYYDYPQYIPVYERKLDARKKLKSLTARGETLSPVEIEGRAIARTFWGKAWCDNIESYHDYENRLPRGRSYVRNGSVIDLQISRGSITAQVMGSELYEITITIKELEQKKWQKIKRDCAGKISSLIDLIQGRLGPEIIELLCRKEYGMFPAPKEIKMICNCPDWADLCKHLAAVLYGVGARLDKQPELFFLLRGVDQSELLSADIAENLIDDRQPASIADDELSNIFGIELDSLGGDVTALPAPAKKKPGRPKKTDSEKKTEKKPTKRSGTRNESKPAAEPTRKKRSKIRLSEKKS